jgi:hypothetical protein
MLDLVTSTAVLNTEILEFFTVLGNSIKDCSVFRPRGLITRPRALVSYLFVKAHALSSSQAMRIAYHYS